MEKMLTFIGENRIISEIAFIILTGIITFLFGRYTSYLDDRRAGRKDINESFYKPFLSLYKNEHHACALFFADLDFKVQKKLIKLLLDNTERVSPVIKMHIYDLDQYFSGYLKDFVTENDITDEDKEYVEKNFGCIYNYVEKQYIKNERKLYCSFEKRMLYKVQEILIWCNILKL